MVKKGVKLWKKGQSSSSNPTTKKFRDVVKNRFFNSGQSSNEKSNLTMQALSELDSKADTKFANNIMDNDNKSVISDADSNDTFRSWASNWSDCTNATFNKVHRYWRSNSALHKEILSVLAAITEIIKENDGKETEIEYFAALMTGLSSVKDMEESTAAFFYLIALAIKKIPENVLRAKYTELLEALMEPLVKYGEEANNVTLIKSGLMCLCWLLKSQDKRVWQAEQTQNAYMLVLSFIDHQKPKIRKCGHEAVRMILNGTKSAETSVDDISAFTAEYCIDLITNGNKFRTDTEKAPSTTITYSIKKTPNKPQKAKNSDTTQTILHTLTLIKQIVHHFHIHSLKSVGECLLRLITLNDILTTSLCFQVFHQLFQSQTNNLSADLNAQIINALYDYQPSENDPQQLIAWMAVMESAVKCLNRLNKELCITHLSSLFQTFMLTLSSSHHKNVHAMVANVLCSVLEQCVAVNIELFTEDLKKASETKKSLLAKIFQHIEAGLSYQFHTTWLYIMKVLATAFTSFKHCDTFIIVDKCLASLANLRESDQFDYKKEADYAIGRAISTFGPRLVLTCIPLHITGDETKYDFPRSWLLPLLKDNIEGTELAYFVTHFLPLAKKLRERTFVFSRNKQLIEAKIFDNLQVQIWSLLPGFCSRSTDLQEAFKGVAKQLGETLEKSPDLRTHVFHSLRTLILRNNEEDQAFVSKYAKNYLPILFNLYATELTLEKDPVRQSLFDTIKCYLHITDLPLINNYLLHAVKTYEDYSRLCTEQDNLDSNNNISKPKPAGVQFDFALREDVLSSVVTPKPANQLNQFAKHGFLDLIALLGKYANEANVVVIYDLAIAGIENKNLDRTVQKKCYKILDCILDSGKANSKVIKKLNTPNTPAFKQMNESITGFVENKFQLIATTFLTSLAQCNPAAKVPRLRCLIHLMAYIKDPSQKTFLRHILPEVILCIKEVNQKSRDAAFTLLTVMLKTWQSLSTENTEVESLNEFFHLVMVGLAGSTNMTSCTCLALASLAYEFRENISGQLISDLIDTACLLTRSDQKETTVSSVNLLKTLVSIFTQSTLAVHLTPICDVVYNLHKKRTSKTSPADEVNSFNNVAPVMKSQQIRNLVKLILKKLIKKFSYEIVLAGVFRMEKVKKGSSIETGDEAGQRLTGVIKSGLENLFVNIKKSIELEKKKKADEMKGKKDKSSANDDLISMYTTKSAAVGTNYNEIEDLLRESDDDDEPQTPADIKSQFTNKTGKTNRSSKRAEKKATSNQVGHSSWIRENDNEDPLDLLDPMAIKNVFATKPLTKHEIQVKREKEETNRSRNRGFKQDADGRLLIEESDEEDVKKPGKKSAKPDELDDMMDTLSLSKKSTMSKKSIKKRAMDGDDSDEDDVVDDVKTRRSYKPGGSGIHRKLNGKREVVNVGNEYKAKKARGDVKKKDKVDPYAYLPLNMGKLNKRKRAKLQGEYKGIVKAVHKGAAKGKKPRKRL